MADGLKTHHEWVVLKETEVFARLPYLRVIQQTVDIGDDRIIDDFFQVHLRRFAICVPFLEDGRVQVIRQYKHGPGRVCLSFPAGFLEEGEVPEMGARRELTEETGLEPAELIFMGGFVDNGNQRGCQGNFFLGKGCRKIVEPNPGDLEEFEYLDLYPDEIDQAIKSGDFAITHHVAAWGLARLYSS